MNNIHIFNDIIVTVLPFTIIISNWCYLLFLFLYLFSSFYFLLSLYLLFFGNFIGSFANNIIIIIIIYWINCCCCCCSILQSMWNDLSHPNISQATDPWASQGSEIHIFLVVHMTSLFIWVIFIGRKSCKYMQSNNNSGQ